jgi:glycosyltransferase involved in cell wall biosynthesis
MKISALTDHIFTPSSRFRVRQYINPLKSNGIFVNDLGRKHSKQLVSDGYTSIKKSPYLVYKALLQESLDVSNTFSRTVSSRNSDAVWLSRQLIIGYPSFEFLLKSPLIYDIDDSVFLTSYLSKKQVEYSAKRANLIFAGNDYLADYLSQYNKSIHIVPTVVDTNVFTPRRDSSTILSNENEKIVIGWSGGSSSYKFFQPLEDMFIRVLKKYKNVRIVFVSDRPPYELKKLLCFIEFIKWSDKNEASTIQNFDIGIMPLEDSEWVKGKCAYKMLLYASCGVPIVASPFGENKKILDNHDIGLAPLDADDWFSAIETLIIDHNMRSKFGIQGRKYVLENKSLKVWANNISNLILNKL